MLTSRDPGWTSLTTTNGLLMRLWIAFSLALAAPTALAAPADWTCDPLVAEDDICDCGCGVADPVCEGEGLLQCEVDNCSDADGNTFPSPLDPGTCTDLESLLSSLLNFDLSDVDIPEEALCPSSFIGAGDGCDCGCGVVDPDCASSDADACEFDLCDELGLELNPDDATQCQFPEDFGLFDLLGLSDDLCSEDDDDDDDDGEPDANEPDANEPDANEPGANEPDGDEPDANEPDGDEPDADEPDADEPDADEPDADEPDADEPDADEPDADEPDADEPDDVDGGPDENGDFLFAEGQGGTNEDADDDIGMLPELSSCSSSGADASLIALLMVWGAFAASRLRRRRAR